MKIKLPPARYLSTEAIDVDEATEVTTEVELEHCWFAKIVDVSELDRAATVQQHEQWTARCEQGTDLNYSGCVRVRKVVSGGETFYIMTVKNFQDGKLGCLETEFEVNESVFNSIKRISPKGMHKTRYSFPIDGTNYCWEIDVFDCVDGSWVKVDLEVDDVNFKIPPFPIQLENILDENTDKKQFLMDCFFLSDNPYTNR